MHYLLAMHLNGGAWPGMYLAQFMHLLLIVLAILAACGLAEEISTSPHAKVLAALSMATVPWLTRLAPIAYNEGGFLLFATLSITWALRGIMTEEHRLRHFVLAGALAGFACGTKLTAVPEVLVAVPILAVIMLLALRRREGSTGLGPRMLGVAFFVLAGMLTFSPWLIRNAVWTGNPVFPEAAKVLGRAHFSEVQVQRWHQANHLPRPEQRTVAGRLRAVRDELLGSSYFGYAIWPLALGAIVVSWRRPQVWFITAILASLFIFWIGFTHLQGRFFILAVPLCAALIAQVSIRHGAVVAIAVLLAVATPSWLQVHRQLHFRMHEEAGSIIPALGVTRIDWLTDDTLEGFPRSDRLTLVGDAKVFWYPLPMSRLHYRTVFDADTSDGRDILTAWTADPWPASEAQRPLWLLIDPAEIRRFQLTYQPFPPAPPPPLAADPRWKDDAPLLLRAPSTFR
jgi:hypothetical protein